MPTATLPSPPPWTRRHFLRGGFAAGAGAWLAASSRAGAAGSGKTAGRGEKRFPFLDWFHVKKGELAPSLDPARISEDGRRLLESLARDSGKRFEQDGHGLRPVDVPFGIRIEQEVAEGAPNRDRYGLFAATSPTAIAGKSTSDR